MTTEEHQEDAGAGEVQGEVQGKKTACGRVGVYLSIMCCEYHSCMQTYPGNWVRM